MFIFTHLCIILLIFMHSCIVSLVNFKTKVLSGILLSRQIHSRKSHMHKEYRHHRCCQRLNRCKQTCLGTSDQTNPFHITAKGHYRTKYDHDCNAADTLPVQKDISRHRPWLHKWCQTDSTDQQALILMLSLTHSIA